MAPKPIFVFTAFLLVVMLVTSDVLVKAEEEEVEGETTETSAEPRDCEMDRAQILLVGLPLFLLCSDVVNLFVPPPPRSHAAPHDHHDGRVLSSHAPVQHVPDMSIPLKKKGLGVGTTINLSFCSSCSYRGNAMTVKKMLETYFPGINVVLSNYPPPLPKRILSKAVPVVQAGVFGIIMAGEHILPRLGYVILPSWYHSLRANRFGTIASTWLLGNMFQNMLHSSGAFEVYCNGDLVFSKLRENRFPGELELKDIISQRVSRSSALGEDIGNYWAD